MQTFTFYIEVAASQPSSQSQPGEIDNRGRSSTVRHSWAFKASSSKPGQADSGKILCSVVTSDSMGLDSIEKRQ